MTWLTWLLAAALIAAIAALTGIKPQGTRHVAHTRLIGIARVVLLLALAIGALFVFRARFAG
jgi:hypothetical protein